MTRAALLPFERDLPAGPERFDGWSSTTASIGGVRDKHRGVFFQMGPLLTRRQLDALYVKSKVAARMVDRVVDDALREGWSVTNMVGAGAPSPDEIRKWTNKIELVPALKRGGKWSRLYGASVLCLPVLDRRHPGAPMLARGADDMFPIKVVPAEDARPNWTDGDFYSPTYLRTLDYDITGIASETVRVHHSRVIPWEAIDLPPRSLLELGSGYGWGPSILDRVFDELSRDGAAATQATAMMYIASQLVIKQKGLWQKIQADPEKVQKWLAEVRRKVDSLGILAVDDENTVEALTLALDGVHQLLGSFHDRVASVADMPREILFNESPTGLRGGELSGPQAIHFQGVAAWQEEQLEPKIRRVLDVLFEVKGVEVESYEIKFAPLWTPDETETADNELKQAQADQIHVTIGTMTPDEVRRRRGLGSGPSEDEDLDLSGELDPDEAEAYTMGSNVAAGSVDVGPAIEIVKAVAAGEVPRDAGVALLAAAGYSPDLLGSAGMTDPAVQAAASVDPLPEDITSVKDAATRFGVPTRTITRMIETGAVRYWGLNGKKQVSIAEVEAAARSHETEPAPTEPVPEV